jgi:ribosome-associated protein
LDTAILTAIHEAACSKMAVDPVILDLRQLTPFTDYFYICHGETSRQNLAVAEAVLDALSRAGISTHHVEGMESAEWILVDAEDVVVHVFSSEKREFYRLENLWGDAVRVELPACGGPPAAGSEG